MTAKPTPICRRCGAHADYAVLRSKLRYCTAHANAKDDADGFGKRRVVRILRTPDEPVTETVAKAIHGKAGEK